MTKKKERERENGIKNWSSFLLTSRPPQEKGGGEGEEDRRKME